jgi:hypothetical protein
MSTTESGLFGVLQEILRGAEEPMTCVAIYNGHEKVRENASSPNRVSDYLGGLWRKGLVARLPAPRTDSDSSRWAYVWRHEKDVQKLEPNVIENSFRTILKRPEIEISENGKHIVIDLPELSITIKVKN